MRSNRLIFSASLMAFALAGIPSNKAAISYADFSSSAGLQLNGSTHLATLGAANVLRLTDNTSEGGSAFSTSSIALTGASFSTFFSFEISHNVGATDSYDGVQGADGLVFVVETLSNNVGGVGGGIGYAGINRSVGIEFDTWFNGFPGDINGNHVGIDINGSTSSVVAQAVGTPLNNSQVWNAWVDYNGVTDLLEVRYSLGGPRPASPNLTYSVDLESVLVSPNAYVGFTSGTGAAGGYHDILQWQFNAEYAPIESDTVEAVPEVQTYASALGALLIGAQVLRRRIKARA